MTWIHFLFKICFMTMLQSLIVFNWKEQNYLSKGAKCSIQKKNYLSETSNN